MKSEQIYDLTFVYTITYNVSEPTGFVWRHVKAVLRLGRGITETD